MDRIKDRTLSPRLHGRRLTNTGLSPEDWALVYSAYVHFQQELRIIVERAKERQIYAGEAGNRSHE